MLLCQGFFIISDLNSPSSLGDTFNNASQRSKNLLNEQGFIGCTLSLRIHCVKLVFISVSQHIKRKQKKNIIILNVWVCYKRLHMGLDLGKPGLMTTFSNFTCRHFQLQVYVMINMPTELCHYARFVGSQFIYIINQDV